MAGSMGKLSQKANMDNSSETGSGPNPDICWEHPSSGGVSGFAEIQGSMGSAHATGASRSKKEGQSRICFVHSIMTYSPTDQVVACGCRDIEEVIYQSLKDQWNSIRRTKQYRMAVKCGNRISDGRFVHTSVIANFLPNDIMTHVLSYLHPPDFTPYYSKIPRKIPVAKDMYSGDDVYIVMGETDAVTMGFEEGQCHPSFCHTVYNTYDTLYCEVLTRVTWIRDLTSDGDVEQNPGPPYPQKWCYWYSHKSIEWVSHTLSRSVVDAMLMHVLPDPRPATTKKKNRPSLKQRTQAKIRANQPTLNIGLAQIQGVQGKKANHRQKEPVKHKDSQRQEGRLPNRLGRLPNDFIKDFVSEAKVSCTKHPLGVCATAKIKSLLNSVTVTNGIATLPLETGHKQQVFKADDREQLAAIIDGTNCKCGPSDNCGRIKLEIGPGTKAKGAKALEIGKQSNSSEKKMAKTKAAEAAADLGFESESEQEDDRSTEAKVDSKTQIAEEQIPKLEDFCAKITTCRMAEQTQTKIECHPRTWIKPMNGLFMQRLPMIKTVQTLHLNRKTNVTTRTDFFHKFKTTSEYVASISAFRVEIDRDGSYCHQVLCYFGLPKVEARSMDAVEICGLLAKHAIPYVVTCGDKCWRNTKTDAPKCYLELHLDPTQAQIFHASLLMPTNGKFHEAVVLTDGLLGISFGGRGTVAGLPTDAHVLGNQFGTVDAEYSQLQLFGRAKQFVRRFIIGNHDPRDATGANGQPGMFLHYSNCRHVYNSNTAAFRPSFPQLHDHEDTQVVKHAQGRTTLLERKLTCCCFQTHLQRLVLQTRGLKTRAIGTAVKVPLNVLMKNTNYFIRKTTAQREFAYVESTRAVTEAYYQRSIFSGAQLANAEATKENIDKMVPVADQEALAKYRTYWINYQKMLAGQQVDMTTAEAEVLAAIGSFWQVEAHTELRTVIHTLRSQFGMADKYRCELSCSQIPIGVLFDTAKESPMWVHGKQHTSRHITKNTTAGSAIPWANDTNMCMHHSRKPEYCTACRNFTTCGVCGCYFMHNQFPNQDYGRKQGASRIGQIDHCGYCSSKTEIERAIKRGMLVGHVIKPPLGVYNVTPFQIFRAPLQKSGKFSQDVKVELVEDIPTKTKQPGACFYGIGSVCHCPTMATVDTTVAMASLSSRQLAEQKPYNIKSALDFIDYAQRQAETCSLKMAEYGYKRDGRVIPESMVNFLRKYPSAKRQRYFDAYRNLVSEATAISVAKETGCVIRPQSAKDAAARFKPARRSIFIKNELLQPAVSPLDLEDKAARIICSSEDPERNVRFGPYVASIQSFFKKYWGRKGQLEQEDTPVVFACGMSAVELGKLMGSFIDFGYVVGADYSKYDSNQKWFHFHAEKALYEKSGMPNKSLKVFLDQAENTATIRIGGKVSIRARWKFRRNSGDPNTTMGNTWLNAMMLKWCIKRICRKYGWSVRDFWIAVGGDDVMLSSKHHPSLWRQELEDMLLKEFGMPTEWQTPLNPMNVRFMGSTAYYANELGIVAGPCIERFLQKVGWSSRPQTNFLGWNKGVAKAWLASFGHVPFVHDLCSSLLRCSEEAEEIVSDQYKFKNQQQTWMQPDHRNYQVVSDQLTDIGKVSTVEAVKRLSSTLGSITKIPSLVSDPIWDQLAW